MTQSIFFGFVRVRGLRDRALRILRAVHLDLVYILHFFEGKMFL